MTDCATEEKHSEVKNQAQSNNPIEAIVTDAFMSLEEFVGTNSNLGYAGYQISQAKFINVLLVGRSHSGKSTLLETFMQPQQAVIERSFSVTQEPKLHTFVITNQETKRSYTMNFIDTPGLREMRIDEDMQARGDEEIIKLISQFLSNELIKLNIVIYVAVAGKTHERDSEAFDQVRKFLGDEFAENSMLVLSHCETLPKKRIDQIIEEIKRFHGTKEIIDYCKLGVFPYGTLSEDELTLIDEEEPTPEAKLDSKIKKVKERLTKIENMRKSILDVILKMADKGRPITLLEGVIKHINQKNQQTIKETLNKERDYWNKQLDIQIHQYEGRLKEMQKEEFNNFQIGLAEQIKQQRSKYEQRIKEQAEKDSKNYEERLNHQLEQCKIAFENKICTLMNEDEKREEAKRFASELERKLKEQEIIYNEELKRQRNEQESLYREQEERERNERQRRLNAEHQAEQERRRANAEKELRLKAASQGQCIVM